MPTTQMTLPTPKRRVLIGFRLLKRSLVLFSNGMPTDDHEVRVGGEPGYLSLFSLPVHLEQDLLG